MTGYAMGETVWFYGDEYVILDEPHDCFRGMFQNAQATNVAHGKSGRIITVPIPEQKAADITKRKQERAEEQAGFSRLKALKAERTGR